MDNNIRVNGMEGIKGSMEHLFEEIKRNTGGKNQYDSLNSMAVRRNQLYWMEYTHMMEGVNDIQWNQ